MGMGSAISGYFKQFVAEIVGSQKLQEEGKREVQTGEPDAAPSRTASEINMPGRGPVSPDRDPLP